MQLVDRPWGKVLLDSAGTERPFMLKSDGQTYAAPDNYPVQLYKNPDGTFTLQEINESGGYQAKLPSVVFDGDGKVIRLLDGKENTTSITRVGDKISLKDASSRVVELTLVNGTVDTIRDPAGQIKVTYNYSGGYLTQVTYKDAAYGDSSLKYGWDKGQLRSMTDKNGTPYYLTYDKLNRIASAGEINMLGNPSFEAGYGSNLDSWEEAVDDDYGGIAEDSTNTTTGKGSVHIQSSPTLYPGSNQSFLYVYQTLPIKSSTTYNLSAKLKTSSLNGRAFLNIVQTDINGTILDSTWKDTRSTALTGTKDWTKQSLSVTTQSNAVYLNVYLEVDHDNTHFGGDAYFDEAQLVEGAAAAEFHGHTEIGFGGDGWVTSPLGDVTQYVHNNYGNPITVVNDPGGLNSTTRMTWNAADQLKSFTTPLGNTYNYEYDPLGNMTKATDPKNNQTNYEYFYNRLKKLTQADLKNVQNTWDPVSLDNQTQTDQAGNSKAYDYNAGNLTMESNLLGIADNRIYNSGFNEVDANNQPLEWERVAPAGSTNLSEDDPTAPFGGSRVLKLNPGTNHNTYQWTGFISVADKASGSYILSGDIKATLTSETSSGAVVYIYWYDASKQPTGSPSSNLYFQVNDPSQKDKWNHYTATDVQPPANAVYARIMAITYQGATGYFDNFQFEQSPQIRGYNALQNSSFVNGLSKWVRSSSYADVISEVGTINLPSTGSSYLESQTLIPVIQDQDYTLSGNLTIEQMSAASGNGASLQVQIYNQSGTYLQTIKSKVVSEKSGMAKYVIPFKSPVNGTAKVRLDVTSAQGIAMFDNIRFGYGRDVVTSSYDPSNNYVVSTTNQLNKTVSYGNDAYGQATSVTSPTGEVIRYAYDGQERLRTVTDNAGNLTTYNLDANGNVLSVNTKAPTGTTYNQSSFVYDDKNNLQAEKNSSNSIVSSYAYDLNGRLTQKTNASGSIISLEYGPLGLLQTLRLSGNETYGFSYDLEGQRKQATVSKTPTGPLTNIFEYDYDKVGNLISSVEKDGSNNFLGSITKPAAGDMYSKTDQLLGFDLKYQSNPAIPYAFLYSPNKLVEKVSAAGKDTLFRYDEGSKLKLQTNPNGVEDRFEYNEGNQLISTSTFKPGSDYKTRISSQYNYDDDGRLIEIKGQGPGSPSAKYFYNDVAGTHLTQAEITDSQTKYTLDYSYDPAGNLKTMDVPNGQGEQTNTFAYNGDNKISSINGSAGNVSYDANGNLTKLTVNNKTQQYVYDAANRLTAVKDGAGAVIASYTYDGDGQRLTKTVGSETITYHYFKGQLMYETSNKVSGQISARYTRTPEGKLLSVSIYAATGIKDYYYHYNAHGDVVAVTDSNGALYRQYAYDPYGNVISVKDGAGVSKDMSTDDFNHAYTYAGYRYDQETGLYFLNARYYNAGIGRFLTKDTFKGRANDPQSINRYAYAHGNPVSFVDPTGHDVGAPGMDLGVYTEYQKQGLYPTGSYDTPMPVPVSFDQKSGKTQVHSTSDDTNKVINNTLLVINRGATAASIGASTAGIVGVAIGSATLISTAGIIIPVAATVGVATTLGMMLIGDQVHGTWGNVAISLTGFLTVPILGGASHLIGTELYNAAMATGFAFNIPLSAVTASWN